MRKKFIVDVITYSLAPQLPRAASVLILPFITPFLTVDDYAIYGTVMAYAIGFDVLKTLGLEIVLLNSFIKDRPNYHRVWGTVQALISIWSFVLSFILAFLIFLVLPNGLASSHKSAIIISICLPITLFTGLSTISSLYYQYHQKPKPIVVRSIIFGLIAVVLNYYLISVIQMGFMGWFYSSLLTGLLMPITYVYPIWIKKGFLPLFRKLNFQDVKKMLKVSLPMLPHNYSSYFLNYSDRVLLNIFNVPNTQVGIYNLGYSISNNFRFVTTSVDKVVGPAFHKLLLNDTGWKTVKNITYYLAAAYLLIGFLGAIWMKNIFQLMIRNDSLVNAYPIAIIVLFSFVTRPLYNGAQSFLFFHEKTSKLWLVTFLSGVLNIVLNIVTIPVYGIWAAALNTFICMIISNYGLFFLSDYKRVTDVNFYPYFWILATIVICFLGWLLRETSYVVKVVSSILSIGVCGVLVLIIRKI